MPKRGEKDGVPKRILSVPKRTLLVPTEKGQKVPRWVDVSGCPLLVGADHVSSAQHTPSFVFPQLNQLLTRSSSCHIYFWSDFRISNALWLERILRYCISWNVNTERGIMNIKEVIPLQKAFLCIIYCL